MIDSHQHFVDVASFEYYWMSPEMPVLRRNFLPENLLPLLQSSGIEQTVAVQAHPSPEESRYLVELAKVHPFIGGIVAWVDLTNPIVEVMLEELSAYAKVKAVRHQTAEDEPADWFLREDVIRGLRSVAQSGLPYDMLIRPQHLPSVPRLLELIPELRIVIEHMAKPPIASGELDPWAKSLANVAGNPSVFCKVSALVTEADHSHWTVENLKPYVHHALEIFGIERLMWGSEDDLLNETALVELAKVDTLKLVEREKPLDVLSEQELALSDVMDTSKAIMVGKFLSATLILTGTVIEMSESVIIFGRVIDVQTAEIQSAAQVIITKNADVSSLL